MAGDSALPEGDFEEFLVLSAFFTPTGIFRIHPEGFYDRFRKALKLNWEFQTGNPEFDRSFYLNATGDDAQQALVLTEVQNTITQLMPFEFLQVHRGGIRRSEILTDGGQLSCDRVTGQLRLIAKFASLLQRKPAQNN